MWKTKWNVKYFCVCMIRIFLVVGFGSLAVELDPHKATAKQTGRATRCFLIRIFFTEQSGTTVWITDALISSLGDGAGDQEAALGQDVCPTERWGKRAARMAKPCSPGCGVLRGCQKEVGMYVQINVLAPPPPYPQVLCTFQGRKWEGSFLVWKNLACVSVLGSCHWGPQRQLLQVPSPSDLLSEMPGLGGEFSTSPMGERVDQRASPRWSVEARVCSPGGSSGVTAKGPFGTGYFLRERACSV